MTYGKYKPPGYGQPRRDGFYGDNSYKSGCASNFFEYVNRVRGATETQTLLDCSQGTTANRELPGRHPSLFGKSVRRTFRDAGEPLVPVPPIGGNQRWILRMPVKCAHRETVLT